MPQPPLSIHPPTLNPLQRVLLRTFGRPRGVLGRLGGIVMARTNRAMAERCIALLEVRADDRVLEAGFGPGVGIELLARAAASGYVVGIDASDEMLEQASARNAAAIRDGRVHLRKGSATDLPYESGGFDKALAINSLQLWGDPVGGLKEIRRVLKPGGRLVLGFTRHSQQAKEGVEPLVVAAGFRDVRIADLDRDFAVAADV